MANQLKVYNKLPRFSVSSDGEVYGTKTGKKIKTSIDYRGYKRLSVIVGSRTDGTRKHLNLKVHRMVAESFIHNPNDLPAVNHIDGNKLNNTVENLEWMSVRDNNAHARKIGLVKSYSPTKEHRQKMIDGWWKWFESGGKKQLIKNLAGQKNYLNQ